jgi:iron(III) transport system ATP-binding protein
LLSALGYSPDFVLLDEPLSNLDAALKDSLRWEIRDALKKAGKMPGTAANFGSNTVVQP